MRSADTLSSTNGFSQAANGPTHSRKSSLNGQSSRPGTANGDSYMKPARTRDDSYYGHDREEVTRILIQSLYELGYHDAASTLTAESGHKLETHGVANFRNAVLDGRWSEAEKILIQSFHNEYPAYAKPWETWEEHPLLLTETAERNEMLFLLRQQKFLELLESHDLASALVVLRQELTPLNYDIDRLHALSSLLMCPSELLNTTAAQGSITTGREALLAELSKSISPSVMIPQHRLATLLDFVKKTQISNCSYHNTVESPSLYSDHLCDKNDFPRTAALDLTRHCDEVWCCEFSHDGTKLATAGKDRVVFIYDTTNFSVKTKLAENHIDGVACVSWSPDDTKLITCSHDKQARVWNVENGRCLLTIDHHSEPVTAAGWAPDGESFVTGSLDVNSQLCHWSIRGPSLFRWKGTFRVQDCTISPDGKWLVAADTEHKVHIYNFVTYQEVACLSLSSKGTSVSISKDSKYLLLNLAEGEIQLIDLNSRQVVQRYTGYQQGVYVIRSSFGGAGENFVVSGSEDSKIYIWNKTDGQLVEALDGHAKGCVNAISWNPTNPRMFASAGDDCVVRIWSPENDRPLLTRGSAQAQRTGQSSNGFRTSALRTTSTL